MSRTSIAWPLNRRQMLVGGTALLWFSSAPVAGQVSISGSLSHLAAMSHPARAQVVIVEDRGASRWRRAPTKPDIPDQFYFRSADRFTPDGVIDQIHGGWWRIDEPVLRAAHAGAHEGLSTDSSVKVQATLDAAALLGRPVDDLHAQYRIDRSITLPAGVTWSGANLQAGTAGMNVVLISSDAQLLGFDIRGTGTISHTSGPSDVNERAIYPAVDGLRGAVIQGRISNITVGVHLQPLSSNAPPPADCHINVDVADIVGFAGASEGYGVLLSPAEQCTVQIRATNVQRHAVYLSSGASHNVVDASVVNCMQDAVTIYSLASQPACTGNRLTVAASGVRLPPGQRQAGNSCCLSIYGKANDNIAHVTAEAAVAGGTYAAVHIQGLQSPDGPFPQGNRLTVNATGIFGGPYVILSSDAIDTRLEGGEIVGRGSVGIIGFTDTRSNQRSFAEAGRVSAMVLDGYDAKTTGVAIGTERSPVVVDSNVLFARVLSATRDYTGRLRRGA